LRAFEVGDGTKWTYLKMAQRLEKHKIKHICTDGNKTYGFYKISEKFANKFDEFELDGFRLENDFIIARSNLEKLIVEKFMRYNGVKLSNIIDEDEKLNLYAVASYVLCTNLTAFELKIIPINLRI
jgi:IS1 family transposase